MKMFVAGAAGAIGRNLIPMLVSAGYSVTGTTRTRDKADWIRSLGAKAEVVDALNRDDVIAAVRRAEPDVIIHQLTSIPAKFNLKHFDEAFALTNRLRTAGTDYLLAAAKEAGTRRFIIQSYTGWPYARTGGWIKNEEDPLLTSPDPGMRETFEAIRYLESAVLGDSSLEGFVLRYGSFYGPGTSLGYGSPLLEDVRKRRFPVIGEGEGRWSFLHIEDAASATLAAVEAPEPGIYNICDDEPAPVSAWLPFLANALGAKPPRHIPKWLGRIAVGQHGVAMMTEARGASNQKTKSKLDWRLKWSSWREGFRRGLGDAAEDLKRPSLTAA